MSESNILYGKSSRVVKKKKYSSYDRIILPVCIETYMGAPDCQYVALWSIWIVSQISLHYLNVFISAHFLSETYWFSFLQEILLCLTYGHIEFAEPQH